MEKAPKHPILVGFVSIFPGAGFWMIGKRRSAVIAAALVYVPFLIYFFASDAEVSGVFCDLFVALWFAQIVYAFRAARLESQIAEGKRLRVKQPPRKIEIPPDIPRKERVAYKIKSLMQEQLEGDERVLEAVVGMDSSAFGYVQYYIGVTSRNNLILVDLDFTGRPVAMQKFSRFQLGEITFKRKLLNDMLFLDLHNDGKKMKLKIPLVYREHMDNLLRLLMGNLS